MTTADGLLIVAIVVFILIWWIRSVPSRGKLLLVAAIAALAAGLWGVYDDRWQAGVGAFVSLAFLLALLIGKLWRSSRWSSSLRSVRYLSGALLTLLAGLAIATLVLFPVWRLPAPTGTHAVGVRTFELDDPSRLGVFHAKSDAPRRLLIRVWYPAQPDPSSTPRQYFSDA